MGMLVGAYVRVRHKMTSTLFTFRLYFIAVENGSLNGCPT